MPRIIFYIFTNMKSIRLCKKPGIGPIDLIDKEESEALSLRLRSQSEWQSQTENLKE